MINKNNLDFEFFLEGIKIPFNNITVRETEGDMPQATLSIPSSSYTSLLLPGSIGLFFGTDPRTGQKILLFEGELTSIGYQKTDSNRAMSISFQSLIKRWERATARPSDAFLSPQMRNAQGEFDRRYFNLTKNSSSSQNVPLGSVEAVISEIQKANEAEIGKMIDLDLTERDDFAMEFSRLFGEEGVSNGSIHDIVQFFLRRFEEYDVFYGILSKSFGISSSIFSFPNIGKMSSFKHKAILENTFRITQSLSQSLGGGSLILINAIRQLLSSVHYNLITPAAYTASYCFWDKRFANTRERVPVRGYFLPGLEDSPPLKNNLFFDDDIISLNYSRNFFNEPTRTIGSLEIPFFEAPQGGPHSGLTPFVLEPKRLIGDVSARKNSLAFSVEESYRGISPMYSSHSSFFTENLNSGYDEEGEVVYETLEEAEEFMNEKIREPLNEKTLKGHMQSRLATRNANLRVS